MTVQPLGYFIDVDYGEWSGKTVEEVRRNWPREFELWVKRPGELVFPGGESLKEVCQRVNEGLLWLRDHNQQRVLLVGHKLVNRIILCIVLGLSLEGIWSIDQSNGAINVITTFDERWMIRRMNDVSHIESCLSREQLT
jgi:broad specificity phosphatase PhoE